MVLKRGARVTVTAFGGKKLDRVVWEDVGRGVLITTAREYAKAESEYREPICVGFPHDSVQLASF